MPLNTDIVTWANTRPLWQQDLLLRFCRNEAFSQAEFEAIADNLVEGIEPQVRSVNENDLPGASTSDSVILTAVSGVEGINALLSGQRLTFSKDGLTIVYGDNGSGKSGYARVISQAVTSLVTPEIIGNVFADEEKISRACLEYLQNSEPRTWSLGDVPDTALLSIRYYDRQCGATYISKASESSYRPSALTVLDRLSNACVQIQAILTARLAKNNAAKLALPEFDEATKAGIFVFGLSSDTTDEEITEATTLPDDLNESLFQISRELTRLRGSDPSKEIKRISTIVDDWTALLEYVYSLVDNTSEKGFSNLTSCDEILNLIEKPPPLLHLIISVTSH